MQYLSNDKQVAWLPRFSSKSSLRNNSSSQNSELGKHLNPFRSFENTDYACRGFANNECGNIADGDTTNGDATNGDATNGDTTYQQKEDASKCTLNEATFNILKLVMGVGTFALPRAFKLSGVCGGLVGLPILVTI